MFSKGDRVVVQTVDEMLSDGCKERGVGFSRRIDMNGYSFGFVYGMYDTCGKEYHIARVDNYDGENVYDIEDEHGCGIPWTFQDFILRPYKEIAINPFTDSDLSLLMGV